MAKLHTVKKNGEYYGELPDTGWIDITLLNGVSNRDSGQYKAQCRRIGKTVFLKGQIEIPVHSGILTVFELPAQFRPGYEVRIPNFSINNWLDTRGKFFVTEDSVARTNQSLCISYMVD